MRGYHVSKDGKVRKCTATKQECPLQHYPTREQANNALEKLNRDEHGLLSQMKIKTNLDSVESVVKDEKKEIVENLLNNAESRLSEIEKHRKKKEAQDRKLQAQQLKELATMSNILKKEQKDKEKLIKQQKKSQIQELDNIEQLMKIASQQEQQVAYA